MGKTKEDKTPINANAKYICVDKNGTNILLDMYDIDDILYLQDVQVLKGQAKNIYDYYDDSKFETKKLYSIMFTDHTAWQLPIDDDTIEIFKKFKNKLDKEK
ncbi:MAG: hypothetical protein IJH20_00095 [Bacilli bacterium]|nr:hypothetical protein [Bacilli bacterium]